MRTKTKEETFAEGQGMARTMLGMSSVKEIIGIVAGMRNVLADGLRAMEPSQDVTDAMIQIGCAELEAQAAKPDAMHEIEEAMLEVWPGDQDMSLADKIRNMVRSQGVRSAVRGQHLCQVHRY